MNQLQLAECVEFEAMSRDKQMNALRRHGVYVGKLKNLGGTKLLYQYRSIYVEVVYKVHRHDIEDVQCFADTDILDLYLTYDNFEKNEEDAD
jgi:hypothetical protein